MAGSKPTKSKPQIGPYLQSWKETVYDELEMGDYVWDKKLQEWIWHDWEEDVERLRFDNQPSRTLPETWFRFVEVDRDDRIIWVCIVRAETFEEAEAKLKSGRRSNMRRDGMFSVGGRLAGKASTFDTLCYRAWGRSQDFGISMGIA